MSPTPPVLFDRVLHTPSELAKSSLLHLQEAGALKTVRPYADTREGLPSFLFVLVHAGRGSFTRNGHTYPMEQGDCVLLDCSRPYAHTGSREAPWELVWAHFYGDSARPYLRYYESLSDNPVYHTGDPCAYNGIIRTCMQLHNAGGVQTDFLMAKHLTDLLTLCVTGRQAALNAARSKTEQPDEICAYIDAHLSERLSLSAVAEAFGLSKYFLARLFQRSCGVTVGDYILNKRIGAAKELLRFTDKPIGEIAALCGIPDTNYFAKVFRKTEGCSATTYRARW